MGLVEIPHPVLRDGTDLLTEIPHPRRADLRSDATRRGRPPSPTPTKWGTKNCLGEIHEAASPRCGTTRIAVAIQAVVALELAT